MKKVTLLMVLLMSTTALFAQGLTEMPEAKTITVLATTDVHSDIWGFSYENDTETTNTGLARAYTYIKSVRAENPGNVVLVDNGDTIQGNILTDDIYNKKDGPHPVIQTMNYMGYDSMTLGNHEYNFGIDLINRIIAQANFPILAANVQYVDGTPLANAYTIIERNGTRIGIIGITNPNAPTWDGEKVAALKFESGADTARAVVDEIKDKCDVLICVAHLGETAEFDQDFEGDAGAKIAEECPELDVLMLGHFHSDVQTEVNGVKILECKKNARTVARFDVSLNSSNEVTGVETTLVDMADYAPSEEIRGLAVVAEAHQATRDFIKGGVKDENGEVQSVALGVASETFQPENEMKGLPEGKLRDTAVIDLINKVELMNSDADVVTAALFKDTSDLPKGDLNYGNIFDIYKFDNTLYTVEITGAELKNYMEWAVRGLNTFHEGDLNISFDEEYPGYLYDMFSGVDYEVNVSKPVGSRIENVTFKGKPLDPNQKLILGVNNYRYSGLKAANIISGKRKWESSNSIRDMIVSYLEEEKVISPEVDNNWKLTGYSWDEDLRAKACEMVNNGTLPTPYNKSLTAADLIQ
ncbi:MAG: 5'-nucleotidase C-terminal domain-containing protein [Sphaerochaetaceae bacterium]|nr:5'-nucleotidase C-terminal domain-containing protein [Sphaerochaetaceae bacterium]